MEYSKPPLLTQQQVDLLIKRGLIVKNTNYASQILTNISYYRLSAYMIPFQVYKDINHNFIPETSLEEILDLYNFDRELRLIILDAIERIEVAVRTQLIYQNSIVDGSHWFENEKLFSQSKDYKNHIRKLDEELKRSVEVFIKHYNAKYESPERPPSWMSLEVISIGLLSKIFRNLKASEEKKRIAFHFGLDYLVLESWLQTISYVRNICAHHSRIWNRRLTLRLIIPKRTQHPFLTNKNIDNSKTYTILSCINYLLQRINLKSTFKNDLKELFANNPRIDLAKMGFPANWSSEPVWQ